MLTHNSSGIQRLWVLNTPSLKMNGTFTYSYTSYYNLYSIYEVTSTSLLTLFIGSNTSNIYLGGFNTNTEYPSTFIDFDLDSPQLTVGEADSAYSISTSNSFIIISTSPQIYSTSINPISATFFTQVGSAISTPLIVVPTTVLEI